MKNALFTFAIFICLLSVGCNARKVVQVVDPDGRPVEGAEVRAMALSINSSPNRTDAQGRATVPALIQEAKWIAVSKPNYKRVQVDVPNAWPLKITLIPEPAR